MECHLSIFTCHEFFLQSVLLVHAAHSRIFYPTKISPHTVTVSAILGSITCDLHGAVIQITQPSVDHNIWMDSIEISFDGKGTI